MRIVFFGTPEIAAVILGALLDSKQKIAAVVTQPDKGSGRGRSVSFQPVKELALSHGLNILQPEKIDTAEFLDELRKINADLFVVAAYAKKIPNEILEMAPFGCINVHPSLLPKYRGAAPVTGAILNGDEVTGVTIMEMAEKMDAGNILMQRELEILPDDTTGSLEERASHLGAELLLETISAIENGTVCSKAQDDSKSTYVGQLKKESGNIDFSRDAAYIERQIRAFDPWPGTYTFLSGKTFKICKAFVEADGTNSEYEPGTVVYADKKQIKIQTGKGLLIPLAVQLEGKKKMTTEEFLRGKSIGQGFKFTAEK